MLDASEMLPPPELLASNETSEAAVRQWLLTNVVNGNQLLVLPVSARFSLEQRDILSLKLISYCYIIYKIVYSYLLPPALAGAPC